MTHYLVWDTETTGQNPSNHDIIDLAVIQYIDGVEKSRYTVLMAPEYSVNLGALRVNGTAPSEWLNAQRVSQAEGCHSFVTWLVNEVFTKKEKPTIIAHNGGFDYRFIEEMLSQANYEGLSEVIQWSIQDTATIANFLVIAGKLDMAYVSLEKLVKHFGIKGPAGKGQHSAAFDAEVTWLVYNKLIELVK